MLRRIPHALDDSLSTACLFQVTMGPVLGEGMFGVTYRGTWRGTEVRMPSQQQLQVGSV